MAGIPVCTVLVIAGIATLTVVSGYLLGEHSKAAWPYVDSFTTWASVISTYLVARKYLENWLYWIVIDLASIYLYIEKGLIPTTVLFVIFVVVACYGYAKWLGIYKNSVGNLQPSPSN